jgi:hypothetical protein
LLLFRAGAASHATRRAKGDLMTRIEVAACAVLLAAAPAWGQTATPEPVVTGSIGTVTLTPAGPAEAQSTAAAPGSAQDGFVSFFRGTELFGTADGYWSWSGNLPAGAGGAAIPYRVFDGRHNQFTLALAEVGLSKPATTADRVGFRFDLDFGTVADAVNFAEPNDSLRNVQQAYLSYDAPVGSGLTIDVGKFVTPLGAEVIEAKDNWNYSRGFLFGYAIPFYHVGVRAAYSLNDKVSVLGAVTNGWNNAVENNGAKTLIGSITLKPNGRTSVIENYISGQEEPATLSQDWRQVSDTVVSYTINGIWSALANYDYGAEGAARWQGVALYAKGQLTPVFAVSPRFEYYNDRDGFTTLVGQRLKEFTLTAELQQTASLRTRFEYRHDQSDVASFADRKGAPVNGQNTFTVACIVGFSSK